MCYNINPKRICYKLYQLKKIILKILIHVKLLLNNHRSILILKITILIIINPICTIDEIAIIGFISC